MQHRDRVVLDKIFSEADIALGMLKEISFEEFNANEMLKRAICMTVINIGELVKSLTDEIRQKETSVPWRAIAGFRDIAAHKYQTLHMEDVYRTVTLEFPELKEKISKMLL